MSSSSWLASSGLELTEQEIALAAEIDRAGAVLLSYWESSRQSKRSFQISRKSDGSFVTCADFASNDLILAAVSRLFPGVACVSEEIPRESQQPLQDFWIVDPLDGTQSFINGSDDFAVLVARCTRSRVTSGFMHFPARALTIVAKSGQGARCNGATLRVSNARIPREACLCLRNLELQPGHKFQTCIHPKWMDSGMAFLKLCRGELDAVLLRIVNHREWDLAAASVIIEESGGHVSDERGAALAFCGTGIKAKYFVASNGVLHDSLLEIIAQHLGDSNA